MVIKVINKKVVFIHTAPNFDTSGMIEVGSIPEPENNGMIAELFWGNGFYYEYHNPPEEVEEDVMEVEIYEPPNDEMIIEVEDKLEELQAKIAGLTETINILIDNEE